MLLVSKDEHFVFSLFLSQDKNFYASYCEWQDFLLTENYQMLIEIAFLVNIHCTYSPNMGTLHPACDNFTACT